MRTSTAIMLFLLVCLSAPAQVSTNAPDDSVLGRIKQGMTKEQIGTVLGKTGSPWPNSSLMHPVYDFDFEGLFVEVTFDWSADYKKTSAAEIRIVRDGHSIVQRNEERHKAWASWVEAHQRTTNTAPSKALQPIGAEPAPQPEH